MKAIADVGEGHAAAQLIEAAVADHADCIVIGSRGRTGVARLVLGNVARAVLFNAPCSVHREERRGGQSPEKTLTPVART